MAAAENIQLFCKQRNKRLSLLRKAKKDYLTSLNEKPITKKNFSGTLLSLSCQIRYSLSKE